MRLSTRPFLAFLATCTLATLLVTSRTAHADTVDFSYTGSGQFDTVTGSGSFVYSGSPSSLTLASLTGFTFTDTIIDHNGSSTVTSSFTYSLADLTLFSATLSGDTLLTLSLQTDFLNGTNSLFFPESFTVTNLDADGSSTQSSFEGINLTSTGQVTETGSVSSVPSIPEPSTLALFSTGMLGLAGAARRKLLSC